MAGNNSMTGRCRQWHGVLLLKTAEQDSMQAADAAKALPVIMRRNCLPFLLGHPGDSQFLCHYGSHQQGHRVK